MSECKKPDDERAAWLRGVIEACEAELEGRGVEVDCAGPPECWRDRLDENWFHSGTLYRAKPQPRYRPFTPTEAVAHIGREVVYETDSCVLRMRIDAIRRQGITFVWGDARAATWSFDQLGAHRFADDGSPCGMREDNDQ